MDEIIDEISSVDHHVESKFVLPKKISDPYDAYQSYRTTTLNDNHCKTVQFYLISLHLMKY